MTFEAPNFIEPGSASELITALADAPETIRDPVVVQECLAGMADAIEAHAAAAPPDDDDGRIDWLDGVARLWRAAARARELAGAPAFETIGDALRALAAQLEQAASQRTAQVATTRGWWRLGAIADQHKAAAPYDKLSSGETSGEINTDDPAKARDVVDLWLAGALGSQDEAWLRGRIGSAPWRAAYSAALTDAAALVFVPAAEVAPLTRLPLPHLGADATLEMHWEEGHVHGSWGEKPVVAVEKDGRALFEIPLTDGQKIPVSVNVASADSDEEKRELALRAARSLDPSRDSEELLLRTANAIRQALTTGPWRAKLDSAAALVRAAAGTPPNEEAEEDLFAAVTDAVQLRVALQHVADNPDSPLTIGDIADSIDERLKSVEPASLLIDAEDFEAIVRNGSCPPDLWWTTPRTLEAGFPEDWKERLKEAEKIRVTPFEPTKQTVATGAAREPPALKPPVQPERRTSIAEPWWRMPKWVAPLASVATVLVLVLVVQQWERDDDQPPPRNIGKPINKGAAPEGEPFLTLYQHDPEHGAIPVRDGQSIAADARLGFKTSTPSACWLYVFGVSNDPEQLFRYFPAEAPQLVTPGVVEPAVVRSGAPQSERLISICTPEKVELAVIEKGVRESRGEKVEGLPDGSLQQPGSVQRR